MKHTHTLPRIEIREVGGDPKKKLPARGYREGRAHGGRALFTDAQVLQLRLWYYRDFVPFRDLAYEFEKKWGVLHKRETLRAVINYRNYSHVLLPAGQVKRKARNETK